MDRDELSKPIKEQTHSKKVGVVIVTHNSEKTIDQTLFALNNQSYPVEYIFLVDSGSADTKYLKVHDHVGTLEMCMMPNIGFSAANNLGYNSLTKDLEYVIFLNPDLILPDDFVKKAVAWMEEPEHKKVGAISGILLGWDVEKERATGLIDSTGIFSTWYGKWFDRARGTSYKRTPYTKEEAVPALCGALMFCRKKALESVKMGRFQIFDETFFCYKEDIDLSLRLTKKGWKLYYLPTLVGYHVRGWNPNRKLAPRKLRLMSAQNELKLHLKSFNPIKILYSASKLIGVQVFDL